jgi:hypothetical protein
VQILSKKYKICYLYEVHFSGNLMKSQTNPLQIQRKAIDGTWLNEKFGMNGEISTYIRKILYQNKENQDYLENYKLWENTFIILYPKDEIDSELFHKHCLLICAITIVFTLKYHQFNKIKNLQSNFSQNVIELLEIPSYFAWLIKKSEFEDLILQMNNDYSEYEIIAHDLFFIFYQTLLFDTTRHPMGEFYTHPQLADLMVDYVYKEEDYVLDPACGSGMFLLSISNYLQKHHISPEKRFAGLNKIYGIDRNPLACLMARTNLILYNFDIVIEFKWHPHIFQKNSLYISPKSILNEYTIDSCFNLIIGNPPWVVLNRLSDKEEKEQIKQLGNELGILHGGKLATSTELTTLFIARMIRDFLSPNGTIFFVTPASLATGAQHEKFRNFYYMHDVEFWAFDKDIFKIHNLCFKAQKTMVTSSEEIKVKWKIFHCEIEPIKVELKSTEIYVPQFVKIDPKTNERYIGRLGEKSQSNEGTVSFYHKKFRQGASLVPRNLLFIELIEKLDSLIRFKPAETIQNKKYRTWEFDAYNEAEVEENYIYKVAKSTGIMPFYYELSDWAFLPLNKDTNELTVLTPKAKIHLHKLEQIYSENMKEGAEIKSLLKRLDYGHALTDSRQLNPFKIIYGGIGSIVKAAILREITIIDTSLYYYLPESEEEAYFLLGILNSNYVTRYVKRVGSTGANGSLRNIHKHPLDLPFPKFNVQNQCHNELQIHAQMMEKFVLEFIQREKQEAKNGNITIKIIQKRLFSNIEYQNLLKNLDEFVEKILNF